MAEQPQTGPNVDFWDELARPAPKLYAWRDLFGGAVGPDGYRHERSFDYRVYAEYIRYGYPDDTDQRTFLAQSSHDAVIGFALRELLRQRSAQNQKGVVAIMGGHGLKRNAPMYTEVVFLARELTKRGFLVASGGGPGAMEAAHLGALTVNFSEDQVKEWIQLLGTQATHALPPDLGQLKVGLRRGKDVQDLLQQLNDWFKPVFEIRGKVAQVDPYEVRTGMSLSVPTWHYGHEPPTPFASHIAKFFQNSLREDKLLAHAQSGIVYVQGGPGTIQEVFQDAAQNYYVSFEYFSPMVFFDQDERYWTESGSASEPRRPVKALLDELFTSAKGQAAQDFDEFVRFMTAREPIIDLFEKFERTVPKRRRT